MGRKLSFPDVDIQSDVPKGKFILKNNSLEFWSCFRLFLWWTKIIYGYNFVAPLNKYDQINKASTFGINLLT